MDVDFQMKWRFKKKKIIFATSEGVGVAAIFLLRFYPFRILFVGSASDDSIRAARNSATQRPPPWRVAERRRRRRRKKGKIQKGNFLLLAAAIFSSIGGDSLFAVMATRGQRCRCHFQWKSGFERLILLGSLKRASSYVKCEWLSTGLRFRLKTLCAIRRHSASICGWTPAHMRLRWIDVL